MPAQPGSALALGRVQEVAAKWMSQLRLAWVDSRNVRSACYKPLRALGLIAILVSFMYPSMLNVYGVSVGVSLLLLGACLTPTRAAWLFVLLGAAIGYLPISLDTIGVI